MSEEDFQGQGSELDELFQSYRAACPDVEPGVNFMPTLWQKIESRRSLWFQFSRLGKNAVVVSAGLCLVLLALNLTAPPQVAANYVDALLPDDSAEQVYVSEVTPPVPAENSALSPDR